MFTLINCTHFTHRSVLSKPILLWTYYWEVADKWAVVKREIPFDLFWAAKTDDKMHFPTQNRSSWPIFRRLQRKPELNAAVNDVKIIDWHRLIKPHMHHSRVALPWIRTGVGSRWWIVTSPVNFWISSAMNEHRHRLAAGESPRSQFFPPTNFLIWVLLCPLRSDMLKSGVIDCSNMTEKGLPLYFHVHRPDWKLPFCMIYVMLHIHFDYTIEATRTITGSLNCRKFTVKNFSNAIPEALSE